MSASELAERWELARLVQNWRGWRELARSWLGWRSWFGARRSSAAGSELGELARLGRTGECRSRQVKAGKGRYMQVK